VLQLELPENLQRFAQSLIGFLAMSPDSIISTQEACLKTGIPPLAFAETVGALAKLDVLTVEFRNSPSEAIRLTEKGVRLFSSG
jgi:hypothetical protein